MKTHVATFVLLTLTLIVLETDAILPGVKIRVTQKGLHYARVVAEDILIKKLKNLKIPDQKGNGHHIEWDLVNVTNEGISVPVTDMDLVPSNQGIEWCMNRLGMRLHADWMVKYKLGSTKYSTRGRVDVEFNGLSVQVTIRLGVDNEGKPTISMKRCTSQVAEIKLKFKGGLSIILNLFRPVLERYAREKMTKQVCKIVEKQINVEGNKELDKIKLKVTIDNRFDLDYSLIAAPRIDSNFLESLQKGEVYWHGGGSESHLTPKPFPPLEDASKMMYLWLSEFTPNSLALVAHKHGYLVYNLTEENVPAGSRSYLQTTCKEKDCIGTLIPEIGKLYPNSTVETEVATLSAPVTSFTKESIDVDTRLNVSLFAHTADNKRPFLVSLSVNLSLSVHASIVNEKITGKISGHRFQVGIMKSYIGDLDIGNLHRVLEGALNVIVIPYLDKLGQEGIDLPVKGRDRFVNATITTLDGSIYIGTNVKYHKSHKPERPELRFRSESPATRH